jgi:hypothetical protein
MAVGSETPPAAARVFVVVSMMAGPWAAFFVPLQRATPFDHLIGRAGAVL